MANFMYRGYRLHQGTRGWAIWYGSYRADVAPTLAQAQKTVDEWLDAR